MKKRTIILAMVLFVAVISTKAQQSIFVEDVGGSITETPLLSVRKITFSGTDMLLLKTDGSVLTWTTSNIQKFYYALTTNINEAENNDISCLIYPNPSKGSFKIDYQTESKNPVSFSIFTLEGQELEKRIINNSSFGKQTINFNNNLPNGTYIVKIQDGKNLITKKVIILK